MLVRANTGTACVRYPFEGPISAWKISRSVGQGGINLKEDVLTIQGLLNLIDVASGGPLPPLAEDGIVGPKTLSAIRHFQQFHHLVTDGRVDPGGPTLTRMNELPKWGLAEKNAGILARAAMAMPELIAMARKALLTVDAAQAYLVGSRGPFSSQRPYELADLYFAFGRQAESVTRSELGFIRTTFHRALTVLTSPPSPMTGGNPFGLSIYTIDPTGKDWFAYSPMQAADGKQDHPDVHSGHIYLCRGLSRASGQDHFNHILFHELIHFVDDESKARRIIDHGYRDGAMRLPHQLRMHNADNYALFASHVHIGRGRLVASQPVLDPLIPKGL